MDAIRDYIMNTIIGTHEKGYQKNPKDKGNYIGKKLIGTNYGISANVLKEHLGRDITEDDMKNLDKDTAVDIMYKKYYKKYKIDKLPEELQKNVLDMTINSGSNGIKILQKKLGVKPDGIIGKKTIGALSASGLTNDEYTNARIEYYKDIAKSDSKKATFLQGWIKRAETFRKTNSESVPNFRPENVPTMVSLPITKTQPITMSEEKETTDDIEAPIINMDGWVSKTSTEQLGGRQQDVTNILDAAVNLTTEGMGKDFGNKLMDSSSLGMLMQSMGNYVLPKKQIDTDYDPRKDSKTFEEITKDLDNDQLEDLLENHSYNQQAFFTAASSYSDKNKRLKETQEYASKHPVLSGVNSVGAILSDAALFMPVSTAIGAMGASVIGADMANAATRSTAYLAGELMEQGVQEIIWAKNNKEYKFDPMLFGFSVLAGAGLRNLAHNTAANKAVRDIWHNQDGFIRLGKEEGERLVQTAIKNAEDEKAVAMARRLVEKKELVSKQIIREMDSEIEQLEKALDVNKLEYKAAEKGSSDYKQLKSQRQKMQRKLRKLKKQYPIDLQMIEDGTHPHLTAELQPALSIKTIAKELGIPNEVVDSPQKLRRFLGIDSLPTDTDFVIEGEKEWQKVSSRQLREMKDNKRLNANHTLETIAKYVGDNEVGNRLHDLANTDGVISKYVFNKGNLVNSDNPYVGSFYNWLAPDGMGRQGKSSMRAIQSQEKYSKLYGGGLMNIFHSHGDELYAYLKKGEIGDNTFMARLASTVNVDDYEETVMELYKKRLLLGKEAFAEEIKDAKVIELVNNFADDYNELNRQIVEKMKKTGVKGVDFDSTEDFFHRQWDYTKARSVKLENLEEALAEGMHSHLLKIAKEGTELDMDAIRRAAKKFAYGIRNADITKVETASKNYITMLTKLAKTAEEGEKKLITEEVKRLTLLKARKEAGDLAARMGIDINVTIPNDGRKLADLLEDNFITTQKRYNNRMAARIAAAEHGIRDINELDEWVREAVEHETKRLADKGVKNPAEKAKFIQDAMESDLKSFKNGYLAGVGGDISKEGNDFLRFANKYNFARLMQHVGFSSIAEVGGTVAEAGISTVLKEYTSKIIPHLKDIALKRPHRFTDELYDEIRTITGIGLEDYAFSTRGLSKGDRIFKKGIAHKIEKGVDVLGRTTQGTFGGIETINRRVTANSLAIAWGRHFKGTELSDGIFSIFTGSRGLSNRVLENAGLGEYIGKEFKTNETYELIKKNYLNNASFDSKGNLVKLNLEKWDTEASDAFGDVLSMQASHILVDPDSTTQALWQSTTTGRILNQYRTFSINANTKVAAYALANAANGFKHGDMAEVIKFHSKLFWATMLGTLAIGLRENVKTVGDGKGFNTALFDEGAIKGLAIGFSRSSMIGGMDTIIDGVGGGFGYDPIFAKTSSYGRSRNFFNFTTTPLGQATTGIYKSATDAAQGNFKKAGMGLFKVSPLARQFGIQQIFNYTQRDE